MRVHVLQHVPFEGIGSIALWLQTHDAAITRTRFFENPTLPHPKDLDLVVVMGGPMSANDEAIVPWLRPEKEFIREAIRRGTPTLGICLGAQLIANALGARVYQNLYKEIGWFPVYSTMPEENVFSFPERCLAFHWHGETFDLPQGAIRLAGSEGCKNQAFQIGKRVIGLQFHLETTPESLQSLIDNCRGELVPAPYVQTEQEMLKISPAEYTKINAAMSDLLCYVTDAS